MEEDLNIKLKEELIVIINNLKTDLNKIKKKNGRLEEGYIKLNSDLKNLKSDRTQLEFFMKSIFPKEAQEKFTNSEYGLYESDDLKKVWMISETQKENEFQKILSVSKQDNFELIEKIKSYESEIDKKNNEISMVRKTLEENQNQLNFYINNFKTIQKKNQELESEKNYLMQIIDEKTNEIDKLQHLELEVAEIKAQKLLMENNINNDYEDEEDGGYFGTSNFGSSFGGKNNSKNNDRSNFGDQDNSNVNKKLKIGKFKFLTLLIFKIFRIFKFMYTNY